MGNKAFKDHSGNFLKAEDDHLTTDPSKSEHCKFHVEKHGDKIALKTHHGKYVSINDDHEIFLAPQLDGKHSLFHLENLGHKVAIKGHHDRYIGAHEGKVKTHDSCSEHEQFEEVHG